MPVKTSGFSDVVIGTQYGDEGKARVVDDKAKNYDIIARFNGGANAGHTIVVNGQKIALKQVPSGIFYPGKILYIGSGCVINISKLAEEIANLKKAGIPLQKRLKISPQAGIIQPHHILLDTMIGKTVGTTRNGIGPAYADRALRMWGDKLLNIRIGDLPRHFKTIHENFTFISKLYGLETAIKKEIEKLKKNFAAIAKFIEADTLFLQKKVEKGAKVLFEGAQAFMLDVNKGSVPYVTSSSCLASAAYTGGDLPPNYHRHTFGVAKAIMSRVGHGPFTSEFGGKKSEEYCMAFNKDGSSKHGRPVEIAYNINKLISSSDPFEVGKALRVLSCEYGTVTARPRRVGALDLVQLAFAAKANGLTSLIITKCDLLKEYSRTKTGKIPLVTGYMLDGKKIDYIPGSTDDYARVKPIVEYRPGFSRDISGIKKLKDLPAQLRSLLKEIEEKTGCTIEGIGVGPDRNQYIKLK